MNEELQPKQTIQSRERERERQTTERGTQNKTKQYKQKTKKQKNIVMNTMNEVIQFHYKTCYQLIGKSNNHD
jgi:hypothetical protein